MDKKIYAVIVVAIVAITGIFLANISLERNIIQIFADSTVGRAASVEITQIDTMYNFNKWDTGASMDLTTFDGVEETDVEGILVTKYIDRFDEEISEVYTYLIDENRKYRIISEADIDIASGSTVTLKGKVSGTNILLESTENVKVIRQKSLQSHPQTDRFAVVMLQFSDQPSEPYSMEYVSNVMSFVDLFYQENSYGKKGITWDIYGYYNLGITSRCNVNHALMYSLADEDVNFQDYDGVIFIFNPFSPCIGGEASIGKTLVNTNDGQVWIYESSIQVLREGVVTHELGHNFGLRHANRLECPNSPIPLNDMQCTSFEYGDYFGSMGCCQTFHFNAYHKDVLGWINGVEVDLENLEYGKNITIDISPIEINDKSPKFVKIQRGNIETYYIEFRQPIGLDSGMYWYKTNVEQGALIHLSGPGTRSRLIDIHPPWGSGIPDTIENLVLLPGETFTDPIIGVSITVNNIDVNLMSVTIGKVPSLCVRSNPELRIEPSEYYGPRGQACFNLIITNNDEYCLERKTILDGNLGMFGPRYSFIHNPSGYAPFLRSTQTITRSFCSTPKTNTQPGTHNLYYAYGDTEGFYENVQYSFTFYD